MTVTYDDSNPKVQKLMRLEILKEHIRQSKNQHKAQEFLQDYYYLMEEIIQDLRKEVGLDV